MVPEPPEPLAALPPPPVVNDAGIENKVWGLTRLVYRTHDASLHHASIKAGGYSSQHYHAFCVNRFYVLGGILNVHIYATDGTTLRTLQLTRGQTCEVPAGMLHRFHAVTPVELLEIYTPAFPPTLLWSIDRRDEGGVSPELPVT